MLHSSTKKLIDKLGEMTRKRRIGWAETDDGRLAYQTEGYSVILGGEPQSMQLLSREGKLLEEVSAEEIAESRNDDGTPYQQAFAEMHREAARQARGTETAIDTVLAGLDLDGDGIPDLPVEQAEEVQDPADVLEDNVDESWHGQVPSAETTPAVDSGAAFDDTPQTSSVEPAPAPEEQNTGVFGGTSPSYDEVVAPPQEDTAPQPTPAPTPVNTGFSGFGAPGGFGGGYGQTQPPAASETPEDTGAAHPVQTESPAMPVETAFTSDARPATDQMPADASNDPANPVPADAGLTQQPPSASQIWGQQPSAADPAPASNTPAPGTAQTPPYPAQSFTTAEQSASPVQSPFGTEANEAAEALASDRGPQLDPQGTTIGESAADAAETAAQEVTEAADTAASQLGGYAQDARDNPSGAFGGSQAPEADNGTAGFVPHTPQPTQPPATPYAQPQEPASQPAFQPTPTPSVSHPQPQPAQPEAPAYTQTPNPAPTQQVPVTQPGQDHSPAEPHGQAQGDNVSDEDEEGAPPPKPITRFNPWN